MAIQRTGLSIHSLAIPKKATDLSAELADQLFVKTASAKEVIAKYNLRRVAGNVFECPSTRDFWEVKEGKIIKLTPENEVDNGESMVASDSMNPEKDLTAFLDDLEFYA